MKRLVFYFFFIGFLSVNCTEKMVDNHDCNDFNSEYSLIDSDGDGLTDCEETTVIDNPNTMRIPRVETDPDNPFNGVLDTFINMGGALNETLKSVVKTMDGGFVCLGFTQSINGDIEDPKGENDFWVLKYNKYNHLEWKMNYGGSKEDVGSRIIQLSSGDYALVGYTVSNDLDVANNYGQKDIWLLKITSKGSMSWSKTYGFEGDEEGLSLIETIDGGLMVCGYLDVTASGGKGNDLLFRKHGVGDMWVLKLDKDGNKIWRRYFGGSNNDRAYDLVQTEDGGYLVAGTSESDDFDISAPNGSYDYWLVKLSKDGTILWEKSYGGSEIDNCYRILPVEGNSFLLVGNTFSLDANGFENKGYSDILIVKIDQRGNAIWQKTFGGSAFDSATSAFLTKRGNYAIAGNSRSKDKDLNGNKGQNDIWIFKINKDGEMIWSENIGGESIDLANDIVELDDYSLVVVGESNSKTGDIIHNNGYSDAVILRIK